MKVSEEEKAERVLVQQLFPAVLNRGRWTIMCVIDLWHEKNCPVLEHARRRTLATDQMLSYCTCGPKWGKAEVFGDMSEK